MKLNLGCGPLQHEGWINLDSEPTMEPDVVANVMALPFDSESVDQVYMGHVLEHLPFIQVPWALREASRVMKPGAEIAVVGPDIRLAWEGFKTKKWGEDTVDGVINGSGCGGHDSDIHMWVCEREIVYPLMLDHFVDVCTPSVEDLDPKWPIHSRIGWQFAITARKQ